jgi:phage terminase large subunit-like protein
MADLSCRDWYEKLQAGKPPLPDNLPIDEREAALAVAAFNKLRLPDVPGTPLMRDVAAPWARDFVSAIFGTVTMNADRTIVLDRSVRKFFQLVPKKNSKTTNGAAIMMTALLRNRRPNAEFLLVGPTQATAELAYDQAAGMVAADPWLRKRVQTRDHLKTIEDRTNGAKLKVKSFDNKVMTGVKPVAVLIDELHELGKIHFAQKVITQIEGGIIANPEGFIVIITTQSDEPPVGVFKQELEHARAVRDGEYPDSETLAMIYEFPLALQADDAKPWEDPKLWPLVLPNLNRSITIERLLPMFRENKSKGIEAFSIWASQHLNVQIGIALNRDRWRGADYWLAASIPLTLDELLERCEVCTIGGDGGGLDDLFALTVVGREKQIDVDGEKTTPAWLSWSHAWVHRDVLDLRKDIASQLEDFSAAGELTICENPTDDIFSFCDIVEKVFMAGLLPERNGVGLDPQGVSALIDELAAREIHTTENDGPVTGVAQGYRLSGAIWGMERKLKNKTYRPAAQALTRWCASNAKAEQRGNAVVIDKQVAGKAKIDPLISGFNAFQLMARNPVAAPKLDVTAMVA